MDLKVITKGRANLEAIFFSGDVGDGVAALKELRISQLTWRNTE